MTKNPSSFQKMRRRKVLIIIGSIVVAIMVSGTLAGTMSSRVGIPSNLSEQHSLQSQNAMAPRGLSCAP